MLNLIHLSNDSKFLDVAIDQFKLIENVNSIFLVWATEPIKYVKQRDCVIVVQNFTEVCNFFKATLCDYVVLHGLFCPVSQLQKINCRFIWMSWGFDIYTDKFSYKSGIIKLDLYKPLTRAFFGKKTLIKKIYYCLRWSFFNYQYRKFIETKIDYISTVYREEFDFVKKKFNKVNFSPFRYLNVKLKAKGDFIHNGGYILLGNSCDETNNHMDILAKLESLKQNFDVIMPISYSVNRISYKNRLLDYIKGLQYIRVHAICDFMPYEEYCQLLSKCSFAIFGHVRQQAAGNIGYALTNGLKVFLYKDSINYKHFSTMGCKLFSIEDDLTLESLASGLNHADMEKNCNIMLQNRDPEKYIGKLQNFFDSLQS